MVREYLNPHECIPDCSEESINKGAKLIQVIINQTKSPCLTCSQQEMAGVLANVVAVGFPDKAMGEIVIKRMVEIVNSLYGL